MKQIRQNSAMQEQSCCTMPGYKSTVSAYEGMVSKFADCVMTQKSECIRLDDLMTGGSCVSSYCSVLPRQIVQDAFVLSRTGNHKGNAGTAVKQADEVALCGCTCAST
jgi:hypothetical protein